MTKKIYALIACFTLSSALHLGAYAEDMDMAQMKTMKKECMEEHKDNKICHEQVMKKCEEKSSKKKCSKMMKEMHKEMKSEMKEEKKDEDKMKGKGD